jgi:hypothetical protein
MHIDLSGLFKSGRVVDLILGVMVVETIALLLFRRVTGSGASPLDLLGQLLAGALLLVALRCALTGQDYRWTALFLAASLPAHLFDLARRGKSPSSRLRSPPL